MLAAWCRCLSLVLSVSLSVSLCQCRHVCVVGLVAQSSCRCPHVGGAVLSLSSCCHRGCCHGGPVMSVLVFVGFVMPGPCCWCCFSVMSVSACRCHSGIVDVRVVVSVSSRWCRVGVASVLMFYWYCFDGDVVSVCVSFVSVS